MSTKIKVILDQLNTKAALKQRVYHRNIEIFNQFKEEALKLVEKIAPKIIKQNPSVDIELSHINDFEFHLKFSGDTIVFMLHTNAFTFEPNHLVSKSKYVAADPARGYFGMIQIYNFLSDSLHK